MTMDDVSDLWAVDAIVNAIQTGNADSRHKWAKAAVDCLRGLWKRDIEAAIAALPPLPKELGMLVNVGGDGLDTGEKDPIDEVQSCFDQLKAERAAHAETKARPAIVHVAMTR